MRVLDEIGAIPRSCQKHFFYLSSNPILFSARLTLRVPNNFVQFLGTRRFLIKHGDSSCWCYQSFGMQRG